MTPTEKHRETARALLADLFGDAIIEKPSLQIVAEHLAKAEREASANLIGIIADIRQKSRVGAKPMLGELADAIAAQIEESRREGMKRAAEIVDARMILYPSVGQKNAVRECVSSILSEAGEG